MQLNWYDIPDYLRLVLSVKHSLNSNIGEYGSTESNISLCVVWVFMIVFIGDCTTIVMMMGKILKI